MVELEKRGSIPQPFWRALTREPAQFSSSQTSSKPSEPDQYTSLPQRPTRAP